MRYLADTVAVVRHFAGLGRIGKAAKRILRDTDKGRNTIFISIVSMIEILCLSERNRIPLDLEKTKHKLRDLENYQIVELDMDIVEKAKAVQGLELHDRLIVASANPPFLVLSASILPKMDMLMNIW